MMMVTQAARPIRSRLLNRVVRTIQAERLFEPGQHLLVAVSGGADSTALLTLLLKLAPSWRLRLSAAHANFRLRGAESDEDEAWVSAFCQERNVPLTVLRPILAKQPRRSSVQALAREARYDAMKTLARDVGADRIVVGHTADDQAETVLMWMLRGAGLRGLSGMPYVREGLIVRPLLSITKAELGQFLDQEGIAHREDSSNRTDRYHRNRIRKDLLPVMTKLAPSTVRLLQRQAAVLREDDRYLDDVAKARMSSLVHPGFGDEQWLDRAAFVALPVALQRRLLRLWFRMFEVEGRAERAEVIESARRVVLSGRPGGRLMLKRMVLQCDKSRIVVFPRSVASAEPVPADEAVELPFAVPTTRVWAGTGSRFHVQVLSKPAVEPILKHPSKERAVFDADLVSSPLLVRRWRAGDRFHPLGMKGKSKKLQDLFTDLKVSTWERQSIPVLTSREGILGVPGFRLDERFVARECTTRYLVVTMSRAAEGEGVR